MDSPIRPARVLCFGEILWDFLPDGLFPGGAPFNVSYHLHQHALAAELASAVGRDVLGDELLRRLGLWKIPTAGIDRHEKLPTGYVVADVSASGDAHYRITQNVAWDRIEAGDHACAFAATCDALIFGSLALRSTHNRESLGKLFNQLPPAAARIFDVNLRPPHDDLTLVRAFAKHATVLKLNAAEAARLAAGATESPGREEADARTLFDQFRTATICITSGVRGAGLLHEGRWIWEPAKPVNVADTIGAGDAFLGGFIAKWLTAGNAPADALRHACRLGEWVASNRGATPDYATAPR
jgi:fructokinase